MDIVCICEKELPQRPAICTQCRKKYCSAKCKKADYKIHKKQCEFVPAPRDIFDTGLSITNFITDDGTQINLLMKPGNSEFIYGDIATGMMGEARTRVHRLMDGHGWIPIMEPDLALSKFREFYAENSPTVKLLHKITPEDRTHGWLLVVFNDFEHYADCILGKDLSTAIISWETDDTADAEKVEVTTILDGYGRQKNVLMCQFMVLLPMKIADPKRTRPGIQYDCVPGKCILNRFIRLEDHEDLKEVESTFCWKQKVCE
jgi:hypothetical protein